MRKHGRGGTIDVVGRLLEWVAGTSVLASTLVLPATALAHMADANVDPGLAESIQTAPSVGDGDPYIVQFVEGANAEVEARRLQKDGVDVAVTYDNVFAGAMVSLQPDQLADLRHDERVASISRDRTFTAAAIQSGASWGLDRIDQVRTTPSGTYEYQATGLGVDAYVIDSGIRADHVEFGGRVAPGAYIGALGGPGDCAGHGTHVAGTIGGSIYGVAKQVRLIPLKVIGCDGTTTGSWVILALDWIIDHHQAGAPAVLNASLGGPRSPDVEAAFQAAIDDGITVVVAAGNESMDACNETPAAVPAALTVAATDINDVSPDFSNYGSCVDIFAPGVSITSAWNTSSTAFASISGTSMASPHVAGAAALLLQGDPTMSPAAVAATLRAHAIRGVITNEGPASPNLLLHTQPAPGFLPLAPARLLETRAGLSTIDGQFAGAGTLVGGAIVELAVGGRGGVEVDASSVVLNVTVVEPAAAGFVTVYPCGSIIPNSSSVNFRATATVANAVVSKVGTGGRVCIFSNVATNLVVDVSGYFPFGAGFASIVPARLLETRPGLATIDGQWAGIGPSTGGTLVQLPVADRAGVDVDAAAVVLNVTVVDPTAAGFVTVFPCGTAAPNSSSVNFGAGATVANAVVTKVGQDGLVCLYSNVTTQMVVDVNGFFLAGVGFQSLVPARLLETRAGLSTVDSLFAGAGAVWSGGVVELQVAGRGGVAIDATALVLNVTVVDPAAAGFVTVYPCGSAIPNTSSVNFAAGATVANAVASKAGVGGRVCLYSNVATNLVVDVTGYFAAA